MNTRSPIDEAEVIKFLLSLWDKMQGNSDDTLLLWDDLISKVELMVGVGGDMPV